MRCGIFWCGKRVGLITQRYASHGIQLLICASGLLAICIVSLVRRLEKRRELPSGRVDARSTNAENSDGCCTGCRRDSFSPSDDRCVAEDVLD